MFHIPRKVFVVAALDHAVSSAITKLHALERSLHDVGPWEMEYQGHRVHAERFVQNDGVLFMTEFPQSRGNGTGFLLCRGEIVLSFPVDPPDDNGEGTFFADPKLRLGTSVGV